MADREIKVDSFRQMIDSLLRLLVGFGHEVLRSIILIESWLRTQLTFYGVASPVQSILLVGLAVLLLVAAVRILAGVIRAAVVLLVVVVALHFVLSQH